MEYLRNIGAPNVHVTPSSSFPTLISDWPLQQTQTQNEPTNNLTAPPTTQNIDMSQLDSEQHQHLHII